MRNVGDKVRFVGRASELGNYHADYVQLLGQVGVVVQVTKSILDGSVMAYDVDFEDHSHGDGDHEFVCYPEELRSV